jgi:hypothetical protein
MTNLLGLATYTQERKDAFVLVTEHQTFDLNNLPSEIEDFSFVEKTFDNGGKAINLVFKSGGKDFWMPKIKNLKEKNSLVEAKATKKWKICTFRCTVTDANRGWTEGEEFKWTVPA